MGYIDKIQLGTEVYDIHDASAQAALQTKRLGPGNNVTTEYGKDGLLMQQVVVDIEPAQAGSGDPSPSNIRAISGYGSVSVTVSPTNDPTDGTTYTSVMPESNRTFGPADVLEMDGLTGGRPMSSVVVDIEPVQDLHGYDSPWPAGGGASMAQFCDNDYSKAQNDLTFAYTKANEAFSITGTNGKTDENWILFNNQDSFVCQPLTAGETYVFSHNLPAGTYSQITYYNTSSGTSSLVYLAGTGAFHSQSFTVPDNFSSVRAFQIGIAASAGTLSASGVHFEISKTAPQTWSPYSNICPISGHTSVSVIRSGKNLFDKSQVADSNTVGVTQTDDGFVLTSKSAGTYKSTVATVYGNFGGKRIYAKAGIVNSGTNNGSISVRFRDSNQTEISSSTRIELNANASSRNAVAPEGTTEIRVVLYSTTANSGSTGDTATMTGVMLSLEDAAYEPYQGDTFTTAIPDPPGTVYGGTLDLVSGELVVDRAMVDLGNITWTRYTSVTNPIFYGDIADGKKYYPAGVSARITCSAYPTQSSAMSAANFSVIGDKIVGINQVNQNLTRILVRDDAYTSVSDFTTAVTGVQLVYELATPVIYQCTPEEIATLAGTNVLASNAGQVTATAPVPLNVYGGTLNMTTGELLSDMALGQMTYSDLSGLGDQYIGYSANVTALGGKPAVWVRNWKYNDAPQIKREIKSGGIKGVCNAFQAHIHDKSINGSQFRIYFEVDNNITSTSDFITAVQTLENNGGGLYIAYELATPTTYQCAPQEITTLAGTNYITCNAGKVAATVPLDAIEYVDGMIGSVSQARADTYRHLGMSEISLAWENGSINSSGETTDGTRIREIGYFEFINDVVVICDPGYLVAYRRYTYNGTTYTDGGGSNWASSIETVRNTISNNYLRFVIMREDGNTIGIDEAIHVHFYGYNSGVNELFNNPSFHNVCHRGFNQIAPENTIPAFEFARKVGFRYIETDIQFTSDDKPVILHDRSIKRVAGLESDVFIDDLTLAQAREYDVGTKKNALYAGTKIPTFEEMLLWCKRSGVHPYIELKNETATEARIKSLVPIVREYGMLDKVTWISFNLDLLDYIHDVDPKARLGHLVSNLITSSNVTNLAELRGDNEVFFLAYPASGTFDDTTLALALAENIKVETCVYDTVAKYEAMHHTYSGNVTNGLPTTRLMWLAANGG